MNITGLRIHAAMLADQQRNEALAAGVARAVRPGDTVIDVGAGTGILSMLAAAAGARRVYAVEAGSMAHAARLLVDHNGLGDVITVVKALSQEYTPPEPADVILCETLGFTGLEEGFRATLTDARDRMLKPGGRLLPASVRVEVAPVSEPPDDVDICRMDSLLGFDFSPIAEVFRKLYQRRYVPRASELAPPVAAFHVDCASASAAEPLEGEVTFTLSRPGEVAGIALWFDAELAPGVRMNNRSPSHHNHWGQAFLPLHPRVDGRPGDRLRLRLSIDDRPGRQAISWSAEREPRGEEAAA